MSATLQLSKVKLVYQTKIKASERIAVFSSADVYKRVLLNVYDMNTIEHKEFFKVVLLNQSNKVIGIHDSSEGGIDGTYVDVRQILQVAILTNATNIIISHNHPSGNPEPSINDKKLTAAIQEACKFMKIQLLDHMIVTPEKYFSFADKGLM